MALSKEDVFGALRDCYDPEIPVNIVDLGLVYDMQLGKLPGGNARVDVKMTLTAPGCGMGPAIAGDAQVKLLSLPGVSDTLTVQNVAPETAYNLPPLPATYAISASNIPGLFAAWLGTPQTLCDADAQALIIEAIDRLQAAGTLPATHPSFVDFANHCPCELTVSATDIAGGFYSSLYSLQGHRNTFWNGAAFHVHDSSLLWRYSETLLPEIAA